MASVPPGSFHFLEDSICVALWPFNRPSFRYILSMQIGAIVNVTGYLDEQLDVFAAERGIDLYHQFVEPPRSLSDLEVWAKHTIELILPLSARTTVLVLGAPRDRLEAVFAACLRRVQRWALAPALSEFRFLTHGRSFFEQEQFIESFRADAVALPLSKVPLFLQLHNAASVSSNIYQFIYTLSYILSFFCFIVIDGIYICI